MSNTIATNRGFVEEHNQKLQKEKAAKALKTAKALEQQQIKAGHVWRSSKCPKTGKRTTWLQKP